MIIGVWDRGAMITAGQVLQLAAGEIGTMESPPDSNRQKYGAAYR
jgi:hypothetical protein